MAANPDYTARPTYRAAAASQAPTSIAPARTAPYPAQIAPAPRTTASGGTVTVQSGDTAYSLARRHGMTVEQLARANGMSYPYNIRIGQRLNVSGSAVPATGYAQTRPAVAAPAPQPTRTASLSGSSHTVAPGDTLYNISRRYGVNVADIADANRLDTAGTVKIGQRLSIPQGGRRATAQGGPLQPVAQARQYASADPRTSDLTTRRHSPPVQQVEPTRGRSSAAPLPTPPERTFSSFRWPVRGRIISHYGVADDGTRNDGINISVPEGASVKASENGVVAYAGNELKGYGNLVLIRHANDWVTAYAHNSTLLVQRGDTVKRGQIIAKSGQSGSVDQPQVHFEIRRGAKAVNPIDHLDGA